MAEDTTTAFRDIERAIAQLRIAFIRHHMKPPAALVFEDKQTPHRLFCYVLPFHMTGPIRSGEGEKVFANVQGLKFERR